MKSLSFTLVLLLALSSSLAQNNFFLPFGQSTEEVKSFLYSRDYVQTVEEDIDLQSLRVQLDDQKQVEYAFDERGVLYATTITRQYNRRKDAKSIEEEVLEYMEVVSEGQVTKKSEGALTCHTAVADTRVMKLFVFEHQDGRTLTLTSLSRLHGPPLADEDLYYENDILNRQFISN